MRSVLLVALFLVLHSVGFSQPIYEDVCHVYVVDTGVAAKAQQALLDGKLDENAVIKIMKAAQTTFEPFRTKFEEESVTTKHYPFPNSKLFITASVYYTDEMLASVAAKQSEATDQSMLIGIALTSTKVSDVLSAQTLNATTAEVTYDDRTNQVRVKQYVKVNSKKYLIGLQCDCATKRLLRAKETLK